MKVKVSTLKHHPKNKEIYTLSSIEELIESISEVGLLQPLIVDSEVMRSQLINQMWIIREYNSFHKGALNRINKIDSLIRIEIN